MVIGGVAVSPGVEARFTRDLDFAVAVANDREAERIVGRLRGRGYRIETVLKYETANRLATARRWPPGSESPSALVDLLFAATGIETDVVQSAVPTALPGPLQVRVARLGHLRAMKLLAADALRRLQDSVDIANLLRAADPVELELAREGVQLIEARSFARGRNLGEELEARVARRS